MKVALCCIGRLENRYAVEYVEYYKSIGFDKIFIYDNNYDGEEHFEDVLQTFIDDGFVEVIDYRNKTLCQIPAYEECYNKHSNEYDWIAFFDFDEYLTFINESNIKSYLSDKIFNDYDCIHINWMYYGDNGYVKYENKPLVKRFTKPADFNVKITGNFPENNHIKSIVRGGINNLVWKSNPHSPHMNLRCCNGIGDKCDDTAFNPYNFEKCYLRHFATKTIEEWVKYRMKRGNADSTYEQFRKAVNPERFFIVNERTKEKEDILNEFLLEITPIRINNIDMFVGTHKDFKAPISNSAYKIIVGNHNITNNNNNNNLELIKCGDTNDFIDDKFYSEIYMFKNLIKMNYPFKDYVGFCHYRKYFSFLDDIPNVEEILKEYDCIVAKPIVSRFSMRQHYAINHNIEDLEIVEKIIDEKYKDYSASFKSFFKGKILIPYNMFIMRKEDFKEYVEFISNVLNDYLDVVGKDIVKRIEDNKDKYLKSFYPNNTIEYQYRIGGYLAERLTNVFMIHKFTKMKTYPVIITEDKYKQIKKE